MLKASKYEAGLKIRYPFRVVVDYDLDRLQVYRQRCHSRAVLIARNFLFPKRRTDILNALLVFANLL